MILTLPVGRNRVFRPWHRLYGEERLPRLLEGIAVLKKEFWLKDDENRWVIATELAALSKDPVVHCYGLGLYVLQPTP